MHTWFITGASRGFGLALTRSAINAGDRVVATARNPATVAQALGDLADSEHLLVAALDVIDPASVESAADLAVERFGRIDILVNNAGRGIVGAVEEVSNEEARSIFDVNFFGALAVTQAILPVMREQRSGHIFNVSSLGGFTQPVCGWGIYGASKFALEGMSESLAHEVAALGIRVTIVEPGSFRTDFLAGETVSETVARIADYSDVVEPIRAFAASGPTDQPGDPARAAAAIRAVAGWPEPPLRLPLGKDSVAAIEAKLEAVAEDIAVTRDLSISTDFSS